MPSARPSSAGRSHSPCDDGEDAALASAAKASWRPGGCGGPGGVGLRLGPSAAGCVSCEDSDASTAADTTVETAFSLKEREPPHAPRLPQRRPSALLPAPLQRQRLLAAAEGEEDFEAELLWDVFQAAATAVAFGDSSDEASVSEDAVSSASESDAGMPPGLLPRLPSRPAQRRGGAGPAAARGFPLLLGCPCAAAAAAGGARGRC